MSILDNSKIVMLCNAIFLQAPSPTVFKHCWGVYMCVSEQSTRVKIWSKLAGLILTLGHHWIASAEFVSHKWPKRATRTNHGRDWIKERWELFMNKASKLANYAAQRKILLYFCGHVYLYLFLFFYQIFIFLIFILSTWLFILLSK